MNMFSETERQNITLTLLSPLGNPFPLSEQAISDFMNLSKVFTLFSDKEGESRVVSEALLCGLPVVVKKDILGGATDYLNIQNSTLEKKCLRKLLAQTQITLNYVSSGIVCK